MRPARMCCNLMPNACEESHKCGTRQTSNSDPSLTLTVTTEVKIR